MSSGRNTLQTLCVCFWPPFSVRRNRLSILYPKTEWTGKILIFEQKLVLRDLLHIFIRSGRPSTIYQFSIWTLQAKTRNFCDSFICFVSMWKLVTELHRDGGLLLPLYALCYGDERLLIQCYISANNGLWYVVCWVHTSQQYLEQIFFYWLESLAQTMYEGVMAKGAQLYVWGGRGIYLDGLDAALHSSYA